MSNEEMIGAIAWEAHQRGISYGQFAANLTDAEKGVIYVAYRSYLKEMSGQRREQWNRERQQRRAEMKAERQAMTIRPQVAEARDKPLVAGRPRTFQPEAARSLYDDGYNDAEIALELGTRDYNIRRWRHQNNLPPVERKRKKAAP